MARTYKNLVLHASGRFDPTRTTIECEADGCTNEVLVADSYSFMFCFATTGPSRHGSFQCPEEQHFCCSVECAKKAMLYCIDEHMMPAHLEMERQAIEAQGSAA